MAVHIVLVEPEIPQNTGNIVRTCAATGSVLHLVGKLGFRLEDRYLKRAGLDYWPMLEMHVHPDVEALMRAYPGMPAFYLTTKAPQSYVQVDYPRDVLLFFGKESAGLPETLLHAHWDACLRIPMAGDTRSLNLSNSVAIVLYEALRQHGFD